MKCSSSAREKKEDVCASAPHLTPQGVGKSPAEVALDSLRKAVKGAGPRGRGISAGLAKISRKWRAEAMSKMPVASGDIREIAGQPVFIPLYKLFLAYGEMFVLAIGPKKFVVVSDNDVAKEMLLVQAKSFSKGLLSEILEVSAAVQA